jgi:hypothetical protein
MKRIIVAWGVAWVAWGLSTACAPGTTGTPKAGSQMPASIVEPYLKIQEALAGDSLDGVRAAAGEMATAGTALGAPAMKVYTAALSLSGAAQAPEPDIKEVRARFGVLSDALVTYMKGENLSAPEGVRTAYCPMAEKPWLQRSGTISNPYYGKEMPSCGDFR